MIFNRTALNIQELYALGKEYFNNIVLRATIDGGLKGF
jgi:hypothetical protein